MGIQEAKAWFYRLSNVPYIRCFWHDAELADFPEVGRKTVKDDGQMLKEWENKPWHLNKTSKCCSKDGDGMPVLHFGVGGEAETMEPIPFAINDVAEQVKLDREFARSKGFVLDLAVFHIALGRHHTEGFFGRGRFESMLKVVVILIIAVAAVGIAAGYFGSQSRVICVMPVKLNGSYVPVNCPSDIFVHTTTATTAASSVTKTSTNYFQNSTTLHTVSVVTVPG